MDASALLLRQGWRGTGHSLDTSNRGIAKPLLVAHKQDQLGLGKRRVTHTTDDQWWMRAFDESLKNIGTGASEKSTLNQIRTKGVNRGGLYGFFVKGESLKGTLGEEVQSTVILPKGDAEKKKEKKRRREDDADADTALSKKKSKRHSKSPSEESTLKTKSTADPSSKTQTPLGSLTRDQTATIRAFMKRTNKSAKRAAKAQEQKTSSADGNSSSKKDKAARKQAARLVFETLQKDAVIAGVLDGSLPNPQKWTGRAEVEANWDVVWRSIECVMSVPASDSSSTTATTTNTSTTTSTTTAVQTPTSEGERVTDLAVAAKLAKLTPQERSAYAARATAKGQSLEVYVKRRIEKKKGPSGSRK